MGKGPVPNLPHLLVVPNSLVPQWTWELKIFFNPKQIEIHTLSASEEGVEAYLQSDEWLKSETPMIFRIVIVSHTVRNTFYVLNYSHL
jgi:SNF2 family DNA or RNA helicase